MIRQASSYVPATLDDLVSFENLEPKCEESPEMESLAPGEVAAEVCPFALAAIFLLVLALAVAVVPAGLGGRGQVGGGPRRPRGVLGRRRRRVVRLVLEELLERPGRRDPPGHHDHGVLLESHVSVWLHPRGQGGIRLFPGRNH